jgi:hypothetical protein
LSSKKIELRATSFELCAISFLFRSRLAARSSRYLSFGRIQWLVSVRSTPKGSADYWLPTADYWVPGL